MPRVTMPDGQIVDMPDTLTQELGTRLRAFQSAAMPPNRAMLDMSPTQPQPMAIPQSTAPIAPHKQTQAEAWSALGKNLMDGFNMPGLAAEQLVQHIGHALGLQDDKGFQQYQEQARSTAAEMEADKAKSWGGGAVQTVGQMLGTAPLAMVPGAGSGLAGKVATGAIQGALGGALTPTNEDRPFLNQKVGQVGVGTALGSAIPALVGGLSKLGSGLGKGGKVPSSSELLDELGSKLGGKAPGVALQDAANAKYNAAWDEFSKAVAPVDAEAGNVQMNYRPAIDKLQEVLGVGQRRAPMAMPDERRKVLTSLLSDLQEAGDPQGNVSNTFADAMGVVKRLGAEQRRLAVAHGDTEARQMLGDVRDSILQSMTESNPGLSDAAKNARQVFATKVAPLFDKSEGGNFLTQIRDTPTPGDLLGSANQGALTRMRPDKAAIIAKGSSADPLLYSYLDAAIQQAGGRPGGFVTSLQKAMPAVESIADPDTIKAFQGLVKIAKTANFTGFLANMGASAAVGGANPALGATMGIGTAFKPAMSGPGIMWSILQSPVTRKILSSASDLPAGGKALDTAASNIARAAGVTSARWQNQPASDLNRPNNAGVPQ